MATFKVICVDTCRNPPPFMAPYNVEIGDEYTITGEFKRNDGVYYELAERPSFCEYNSELFATLPDKSADEMREEEREAIINLEKSFV